VKWVWQFLVVEAMKEAAETLASEVNSLEILAAALLEEVASHHHFFFQFQPDYEATPMQRPEGVQLASEVFLAALKLQQVSEEPQQVLVVLL